MKWNVFHIFMHTFIINSSHVLDIVINKRLIIMFWIIIHYKEYFIIASVSLTITFIIFPGMHGLDVTSKEYLQ